MKIRIAIKVFINSLDRKYSNKTLDKSGRRLYKYFYRKKKRGE